MNIIKPKFDSRKYYGGQLNNNIKYILVHDKCLTVSYVSVSVNVGNYSDPELYNGLAHFLEHMLFMGSKKYPDIDYYFTKINELGGSSNAYTSDYNTVYYFNVLNDGLFQIFDIFSRFFIDPLLKENTIMKEINAVNEEHLKNCAADNWKIDYLYNYLSNKKCIINKFGTGSLNTLNKPDIRNNLIEFYNKYYISENISICIISSISINEIFKIILNTFGLIKAATQNTNNKFILEKPFYTENNKKIFHFKSASEIYKLIIMWEIPHQQKFLLSKDFEILKYLLLNETYNSFWFNLMNLGYITSLNIDIKYEGTFIIIFDLTNLGYNNINTIEILLYLYLDKIYNLDFIKYVKYIKNIMDINFYYTNKIDPDILCNNLATDHFNYKTKKVFLNSNTIKIVKSNNEYINLFKKYINKNNFIKILVSNKFIDNLKYTKIDHYCDAYLTDITNIEIPNKSINIKNNLHLNMLNIKNFNLNIKLIKKLDIYTVPILINYNNIITEWYGGSSKFKEPIIICCLQISNNNYNNTCRNYILTNISCIILNFIVSIIFNKFLELNYSINIKTNINSSIIITIEGLNDLNIFEIIINKFTNLIKNINLYFDKLSISYIQNIILKLKNNINNINYYNPPQYFSYIINVLIYKNEYTIEELLSCLDNITYDNIKEYIYNIFNGNLTLFTYGNLKLNLNLFTNLKKIFNTNYIVHKPVINKIYSTNIKLKNKQDNLICINFLFYVGNFEPKLYLLINLFITIFGTLFFNELRTNKQLGYIVKMKFAEYNNNYYIIQQILSNHPIDTVKNEIIKFNNLLLSKLSKININTYIEIIKNNLLVPSNNIYELCNIYLSEILNKTYLFYRKQILLEYINEIKLNDLINFINLYININNQIIIIIE